MAPVVTFDAGQTIIDLDLDFLAARLGERGVRVEVGALREATPAAWRHYDSLVDASMGHPWQAFMSKLLTGAGVADDGLSEWLFREQPRNNLWRKTIPDMVALARELGARGVKVAVLSNSEGRLAELFDEIGWGARFDTVVDSGREGVEKPDPRIFAIAAARLGVDVRDLIHIGDSKPADVDGAIATGARAIWFGRAAAGEGDARIAIATDAAGVRAALRRFGAMS